jgi:PAS domain S-box-containing protein
LAIGTSALGVILGGQKVTLDFNGSIDSEDRYRGLLEAAPDAMVVVNQNGGIVLLNMQAEKQFGYQRDELLGQKVTNIIPEGFAERLIADGTRTPNDALAQQIDTGIELSGRRKDGSRFPIEIMLSPLESAEGILVTAAIRNITTRKDSEARYRGLLEAAPDAMVVVNQDGGIVLLNVQAEKQFGYQRDELLGQKITRIIPEGFAERLIADEIRTPTEALAQQIGMGIELSGRRKDGSRFPIEIMLSPLESAEGILVTAAIRNISARNKSERDKAELARYTGALERSNQELDAFAYAASHDLKAPLRVIHNASMWIEEDLAGNLTAEIRENMTLLRSRVRRMDKLLDDLLTYSRIGRETDSSPAEAIAGTTLIENILGLLSPPQGFIVDATSTFAGIEVVRMPLQQILINLISNAIKHHDKKEGRIEVSAEDLGAMFRFSVKDDGPGIPPQYQEQVFKMFKTLKPRDQVEGSGMGLAMVRKHVDVVGGELTLESVVGQGSTFSFTWPKRDTSKQNTKYSFAGFEET